MFFVFSLPTAYSETKISADEILKKIEGFRAEEQSSLLVDIAIRDLRKDKTVSELDYEVMYQNHDKSLLKQVLPAANQGNLILIVGKDMWFYSKGSRKPIRITLQQRLLGGASNADVAKFGFYFDYSVKVIEDKEAELKGMLVLELSAKDKGCCAYEKIQLFVEKNGYVLKYGDFFGISGSKLKMIEYSNYKSFNGLAARPSVLTIHDLVFNKDSKTVIEYKDIKKKEFSPKYFNSNFLQDYDER